MELTRVLEIKIGFPPNVSIKIDPTSCYRELYVVLCFNESEKKGKTSSGVS